MDALTTIKTEVLNPIILLLFALAIGYFLYGVLTFIQNQGNENGQEIGKSHMLWGILGIFFMFAVYGILGLVANTLGVALPS